jgi:hypothetical protein
MLVVDQRREEGQEMTFGVGVDWPGHHQRGILTDEHSASTYGITVLVFGGHAYRAADLTPNVKVSAVWKKARTGPVWAIIQNGIDAGYPIEVDSVG